MSKLVILILLYCNTIFAHDLAWDIAKYSVAGATILHYFVSLQRVKWLLNFKINGLVIKLHFISRKEIIMKYLYFILLISGFLMMSFSQDNQKKTGALTVNIKGLENDKGKVRIAIGDSEENFSSHGNVAYKGIDLQIKDKKAAYTFNDMPYGIYAVKVFHDENDNDKMDSNFMGIPSEAYGFSNNARGSFGPASWDDAKFEIKKDSLAISITVE